jgi:rod shape-determining protein MreC
MFKTALNLKQFLFFLIISLSIFALDRFQIFYFPKSFLSSITNPISLGLYSSSQKIQNQFHFISSARFAAKEKKAAQEQIAHIISENAQLRTKLAETQALLDQQNSLDPKTFNLFPARPIGVDRFLRIDKGTQDKVKPNTPIIFKDNFIGVVVNLGEKSANVKLLTDPDTKLSAFSLNKDGKAKGILSGKFGSEMLLDKILHEEPIMVDDLVYSEGSEGNIPRGLILGRVSEVLERENQIFKQAKVVPVFDIRDLELVFFIKEE